MKSYLSLIAVSLLCSSSFQAPATKVAPECKTCYKTVEKCKSLPFYDHEELYGFTNYTKCMLPAYRVFESETGLKLPSVMTDLTVKGPFDQSSLDKTFLWDCIDTALATDACLDCGYDYHEAATDKLDKAEDKCDEYVDAIYDQMEKNDE